MALWSGALGICAIVAIICPAQATDPRAVVELFTSQGCSSCPAADKLMGELSKDPSIVALSMPIDYWDYLGWKDTLADSRFSARQRAYSHVRGDRDVYTPQAVINGSVHVIGSDRSSIENAIGETEKASGVMSVPVSMSVTGRQINVSVAASRNGPARCTAKCGYARFRKRCRSRSGVAKIAAVKSPTTMWSAICSRSATGTAPRQVGRCRWKTSHAMASTLQRCMSRTAIATGLARCSAPPTR